MLGGELPVDARGAEHVGAIPKRLDPARIGELAQARGRPLDLLALVGQRQRLIEARPPGRAPVLRLFPAAFVDELQKLARVLG